MREAQKAALAAKEYLRKNQGPMARDVLSRLHLELDTPGEVDYPTIPESSAEIPDYWPFSFLPEHEARMLLWCVEAAPEKGPELCAMWWLRPLASEAQSPSGA